MTQIQQFSNLLLNWYSDNKRDLPWRATKIPYRIWVSEIILQQTRVAQGINYYERFLNAFPTVKDLSEASEDEVLKIWQGLGYYSRARNMHVTAQYIYRNLNGQFPESYDELIKLKGIGPYTAAAISSICYNEAKAVVDGNVMRVIARYKGIELAINSTEGIRTINSLADELLVKTDSGNYNQAIMELGALICTPKNVQCQQCPVQKNCIAYSTGNTAKIPLKIKKVKIRNRYMDYLFLKKSDSIYLIKRTSQDIWQGLYDLPYLENNSPISVKQMMVQLQTKYPEITIKLMRSEPEWNVHILSHQRIHARYWQLEVHEKYQFNYPNAELVSHDILEKYPVSKLTERFLNEHCFPIFVA